MIFWTLLLAHIIGDFPLQTDSIYQLKLKSRWGVIPHVSICTLSNIILLKPYWASQYTWVAIISLGIIHAFLDRAKIFFSGGSAGENLLHFFADQIMHVTSIGLTAFWLQHTIDPALFPVNGFWANQELFISLSALIFASFGGTPIIYHAQKFWLRKHSPKHSDFQYPNFFQRLPGLFERFFATLLIIVGGWIAPLSIILFLPRLLISSHSQNPLMNIVNIFVGFTISICSGLSVILLT